ncbi:MAG: SMP-30/gluconolactonase/LRE family protein [Armatimonadetes bacterium]|nr:SMP-30/gluconolactonase/LRE family protein [Armatimonadota bacterium]
MSWEFEVVSGPHGFTEGPAWDGSAVLFSDIPTNRILRYDPATGETTTFRENTHEGNGLMFDAQGRLYGCQGGSGGRRVVRYEPDGSVTVVADRFGGKRLNSPNDLAFDAQGRLWFTDPRYGDFRDDMELDHESVFRATPNAEGSWLLERMTFDTTRPNGLLISPDQSTLYVAQSEYGENGKRELRAYPILTDGTLGVHRVLHNFYPARGIDGMCLDEAGNLVATAGWQESGPGPMLYVFAPNGRVLATHPFPFDRPTNCAWGGPDPGTLYVTGASGHLLRARTR